MSDQLAPKPAPMPRPIRISLHEQLTQLRGCVLRASYQSPGWNRAAAARYTDPTADLPDGIYTRREYQAGA